MKKFNVILATDLDGGFGFQGELPWDLSKDWEFFKSITKTHGILPGINQSDNIMISGRKTWESMGSRPWPGRKTFIVSSQWESLAQTHVNTQLKFFPNFFTAYLEASGCAYANSDIWVIGGAQIYDEALRHWACGQIYWTKIHGHFKSDVQIDMNKYSICWTNSETTGDIDKNTGLEYQLEFKLGTASPNAEAQYLSTLYDVVTTGEKRQTRNAITYSKFTQTISADLSQGFPLLTTKKMFWKGIVEELLFFIRGETDTTKLSVQGIKIWEPNTTQEFLDSVGLDYPPGHMGPMYGYQWRHWGKPYMVGANSTEPNQANQANQIDGFDQLAKIIEEIKADPHSRRILMTDFNPAQASQGVLYPCHSIVMQFYVESGKLSCTMYQRSGDLFLGIPFNIASTSLLTHIISKLTGLTPGTVNLTIGDYHVYDAHVGAVYEQLERVPKDLPQIVLPDFKTIEQVEQSTFTDFQLVNYKSNSAIKAQMVA